MADSKEVPRSPDPATAEARVLHERAMWAHVVPFVMWLFLMRMLPDPPSHGYAWRSLICLALLLGFRPWRFGYSPLRIRNLPLAFAVGIAVFAVWVFPESDWLRRRAPEIHSFYDRWLVGLWPPGKPSEPLTDVPYAPETAGWFLSLVRLAGSAFVIAVIEEFFFRGFVYRWLQARRWLECDPGRFDRPAFWLTVLVFALEHEQWFAGALAGIAYGWLYLRTRDVWAAAAAHVVTNYTLGWYVLATQSYQFW